jgi:hypothetical protein
MILRRSGSILSFCVRSTRATSYVPGVGQLDCAAPCRLPGITVERFPAAQRDVSEGDHQVLRFDQGTISFAVNGRGLLRHQEPDFARLVLETFIGNGPSSSNFRAALLGISG